MQGDATQHTHSRRTPPPSLLADALAYLATLGAAAGLLRPAVVLAAILNVNPSPIHQPFASAQQYKLNLQRYGHRGRLA